MVNLTYLNDASVFWNLKTRYQAKMIHTYSGIFTCSAILVYSPIHTNRPVCDCDQPVQAVPDLHSQSLQDLLGKEEERSSPSPLEHC